MNKESYDKDSSNFVTRCTSSTYWFGVKIANPETLSSNCWLYSVLIKDNLIQTILSIVCLNWSTSENILHVYKYSRRKNI